MKYDCRRVVVVNSQFINVWLRLIEIVCYDDDHI